MRGPQPLGYLAVERAAKRGYTTYGLAGCTQVREAKRQKWIRKRGGSKADPRFVLTAAGEKIARAEGWLP